MEKILNIEEVENVKFEGDESWYSGYDGFKIVTDCQEIFVVIGNGQACCENWGYFSSNDEVKEFISADLMDVEIVDKLLDVESIGQKLRDNGVESYNEEGVIDVYDGDAVFVNFRTSLGVFQLVAYNAHNGYYGHEVLVKSIQVEKSFSV